MVKVIGKRKKISSFRRGEIRESYLLIFPIVLFFAIFALVPLIYAITLSFYDWNMIDPVRKFKRMIFRDPLFLLSLRNSVVYTLAVVIFCVPFGIGVAVGLNDIMSRRVRSTFMGLYFTPAVTSIVVISLFWKWIYDPSQGLLNYLLSLFGIRGLSWLTDPSLSLLSIAIVGIWREIGFDAVIFLAGIRSIPEVFYEQARIDGGSRWSIFRRITLPLLTPTILFVSVITIIFSFRVFAPVFI